MPELVAERAMQSAQWIALIEGTRHVTYGELAATSHDLSERLRRRGVARDEVVAVGLPRSAEAVVAALGVMRAGAAYLPLDPAGPIERQRTILRDAGVRIFIGPRPLYEQLSDVIVEHVRPPFGVELVAPAGMTSALPPVDVLPEDLAYVMYTSGSSGRPKGVEVTHASLMNLVAWHIGAFDVQPQDRASHLAEVGFDAAVWEVWPYLVAGATVVIGDTLVAKDPDALAGWLRTSAISLAYASSPIAERLLGLAWPRPLALRTLLTGADRLHVWPPVDVPFTLVNNYGPTEATVVATSGRVAPAGSGAPAHLPTIGKPIAGVRLYVVDANGAQVPPGEEGELWIGGAGVARGYRRAGEGRAEAFGPDPFDATPGARIFRSGDRGRLLASGEFAFVGRNDEQLNVRGYRVEPAEIEFALRAHPAITAAALIGSACGTEHARLTAYIVAPHGAPDPRELREFLAHRLPAYMVPAAFVRVATLPLTDNGKIDRSSLGISTDDEVLAVSAGDDSVARTSTEERIAAIVAPLLKLPNIGVDDNIFLLGGHSLLGTQILARIRDAFGVRLGLRLLFESPTVAGLAAEVDRVVMPARDDSGALGSVAEKA